MSFSDTFAEFMTETIYGINYTKHDKQNIKRKFTPIIEGKNSLLIKDPNQAQDFLIGYYHMYEEQLRLYDEVAHYRQLYKKEREKPAPNCVMDKIKDLEKHNQLLKDMVADVKKDKIQDHNTHPYCQRILKEKDKAEKLLEEKQKEYNYKLQDLETKKKELLQEKLDLHQEKEKLEETFEAQKKGFIRRAKAENKDEEKMEMKMLKEEVKKLKKKLEKKNKKIIVIEKENAKLQKANLKSLTDSDTDSDSDSDSD